MTNSRNLILTALIAAATLACAAGAEMERAFYFGGFSVGENKEGVESRVSWIVRTANFSNPAPTYELVSRASDGFQATGLGDLLPKGVLLAPPAPGDLHQIVYAISSLGIQRYKDNEWKRIDVAVPGAAGAVTYHGAAVHPSRPRYLAVLLKVSMPTANGTPNTDYPNTKLAVSDNYGQDWAISDLGPHYLGYRPHLGICPDSDEVWVIPGVGGIYRSADGGRTFGGKIVFPWGRPRRATTPTYPPYRTALMGSARFSFTARPPTISPPMSSPWSTATTA